MMNTALLKEKLSTFFPGAQFEENSEWITMIAQAGEWKTIAGQLLHCPELQFDFLFCFTGVDWKTHFVVVYHLTSTTHRHTMVLKVHLPREDPQIDSVAHLWRTAEFHERETFDLFGIKFLGHPDLRRLFMPDEWQGWPLRKDYEDPINMIKL